MCDYQHRTDAVAVPVSSFLEQTFRRIDVKVPSGLLHRIGGNPLMIACTHRSQADYFIAGYAFYHQGIKYLRYAAGDNLTKLPYIGRRFCELGAFTVERDRTRDRAYLVQLPELVAGMLLNNENVLVFPEGGRSYSGAMMAVNQGVIGGAVLAQARRPERDIFFVTAAISYEQLPELLFFPLLERGRSMRKRENSPLMRLLGTFFYYAADAMAFSRFIVARRFGISYGRVCIDVGEPFTVRSVVDLKAHYNPNAPGEFWAHRPSMKIIAAEIGRRFHALYRLMPQHIVAAILTGETVLERSKVLERIVPVIEDARSRGLNVDEVAAMSSEELLDEGLLQLASRCAVRRKDGKIMVARKRIVNYYAAALA